MPRSKRTHPDDVKLALCCAIDDGGMTYREAVEALSRGELADAPAYDFPLNQVGRYLAAFRKRRVMTTLHPQTIQPDTEFNEEQYRRAKSRVLRLGESIDKRLAKGDLQLESQARLIREHALAVKAVEAIAPKSKRVSVKDAVTEPPNPNGSPTLDRIKEIMERGTAQPLGAATATQPSKEEEASGRVLSLDAEPAEYAPAPSQPSDPGRPVAGTVA